MSVLAGGPRHGQRTWPFFTVAFLLELLAKMRLLGRRGYFGGSRTGWICLVVLAIVDTWIVTPLGEETEADMRSLSALRTFAFPG